MWELSQAIAAPWCPYARRDREQQKLYPALALCGQVGPSMSAVAGWVPENGPCVHAALLQTLPPPPDLLIVTEPYQGPRTLPRKDCDDHVKGMLGKMGEHGPFLIVWVLESKTSRFYGEGLLWLCCQP